MCKLLGEELHYQVDFCESCVRFDFTHSFIHVVRRFVIQGFSTLINKAGQPWGSKGIWHMKLKYRVI